MTKEKTTQDGLKALKNKAGLVQSYVAKMQPEKVSPEVLEVMSGMLDLVKKTAKTMHAEKDLVPGIPPVLGAVETKED